MERRRPIARASTSTSLISSASLILLAVLVFAAAVCVQGGGGKDDSSPVEVAEGVRLQMLFPQADEVLVVFRNGSAPEGKEAVFVVSCEGRDDILDRLWTVALRHNDGTLQELDMLLTDLYCSIGSRNRATQYPLNAGVQHVGVDVRLLLRTEFEGKNVTVVESEPFHLLADDTSEATFRDMVLRSTLFRSRGGMRLYELPEGDSVVRWHREFMCIAPPHVHGEEDMDVELDELSPDTEEDDIELEELEREEMALLGLDDDDDDDNAEEEEEEGEEEEEEESEEGEEELEGVPPVRLADLPETDSLVVWHKEFICLAPPSREDDEDEDVDQLLLEEEEAQIALEEEDVELELWSMESSEDTSSFLEWSREFQCPIEDTPADEGDDSGQVEGADPQEEEEEEEEPGIAGWRDEL